MYLMRYKIITLPRITIPDAKTNDTNGSTNITQIFTHINTTDYVLYTFTGIFNADFGDRRNEGHGNELDLRLRTNDVQSSNYLS